MPMTRYDTPTDPHQSETTHFRIHRTRRRVEKTPRKAVETKECVYNNYDIIVVIIIIIIKQYY